MHLHKSIFENSNSDSKAYGEFAQQAQGIIRIFSPPPPQKKISPLPNPPLYTALNQVFKNNHI
jgi:hypothetical protein